MKRILSLLLMLLACRQGGANLPAGVPNTQLPAHVRPEQGRVSLLADYTAREPDGSLPVYFINGTDQTTALAAQDGDVYLKQETRDPSGAWVRAQSHQFSHCGNSYFPISVKAGHFIKIPGYQAKQGKDTEVRYSLYHQATPLSSNVGHAMSSADDLDDAKWDEMTAQTWDLAAASKVALGEIRPTDPEKAQTAQWMGIQRLMEPTLDRGQCRKVLEQVAQQFPNTAERIGGILKFIEDTAAAGKP